MNDEWYISEDGNLILDERKISKICTLTNGRKFGQICFGLENKSTMLTLALAKFKIDHYNQIDARCKESRTIFCNWMQTTFPDVSLVPLSETSIDSSSQRSYNIEQSQHSEKNSDYEMVQNNNENSEEMDTGDTDKVLNDDIADIDEDGSHQSILEEEISEQQHQQQQQQKEQEIIKQKCIGKHVLIPIGNLIEPRTNQLVRNIDTGHVKVLQKQFMKSKELFTVLVGCVHSDTSLTELQQPGNSVIEVIGGNHTRQALQNIVNEGFTAISHVRMDLYRKLTDIEALVIGMSHNEQHEHSKATSFVEKVKLFRNLYVQSLKKYSDSKRKNAINWRTQVAMVVGLPKDKVQNQYKAHLNCAALPDQIWDLFEEFCTKWEKKEIVGQPKSALKQTHLLKWIKISDSSIKENLLRSVCEGDKTYKDLYECTFNKKNEKKIDTDKPNKSLQNKNIEDCREPVSEDVHKVQKTQDKQENSKKEEYKKKAENAEKRIKELEKTLGIKDREIELSKESFKEAKTSWNAEKLHLKRKLEEMQRKVVNASEENKDLTKQIFEIQSEMKNLRDSLDYAEEVAARARSKLMKESNEGKETKTSEKQSTSTVLKIKKRKLDEETAQKKKLIEETAQNKQEEEVGTEEIIASEEDVYLVEYTNNSAFLATLNDKQIKYTTKPICQNILKKHFSKITKFYFEKTFYSYDPNFIISKIPKHLYEINGECLSINATDLQQYFLSCLEKYL